MIQYNQGVQKSIREQTTLGATPVNSYKLLHQNWATEDCKSVALSDESQFLWQHSDGCSSLTVWGIFSCLMFGSKVPTEHRFNTTAVLLLTKSIPHPTTVYPKSDNVKLGFLNKNDNRLYKLKC